MKPLNVFKTFYFISVISSVACGQPEAVSSPPPTLKTIENSPIVCPHASCQIQAPSIPPQFPKGEKALAVYLATHVQYPRESLNGGVEGTVYLQFVVEKSGSLSNINVVRGVSGGCSEIAVRVVQGMPKWIPATKKGQKVCSRFTLPIKFKID